MWQPLGDEVRRKRFINIGGNEYTRQPMPEEVAEANPALQFNFLWTPSVMFDVVTKKGYTVGSTSTWKRTAHPQGQAFGNGTLNYNGGAVFPQRRNGYTTRGLSFLFLLKWNGAETGINLLTTGTGASDGGIGFDSAGKPRLASGDGVLTATNGLTAGQTAVVIWTWTPSSTTGKKIYINGVVDPSTMTTVGAYGFFTNTSTLHVGGISGNQTLQGDILIASMAERTWTGAEVEYLSRNPWSVFVKPRRAIFTGSPVLTHKRRRVL